MKTRKTGITKYASGVVADNEESLANTYRTLTPIILHKS